MILATGDEQPGNGVSKDCNNVILWQKHRLQSYAIEDLFKIFNSTIHESCIKM